MSASLVPLEPKAIRARRRPLAIFFVFAAELLWALVVATPVHTWARRAWGGHPDGDGVLFLAGGRDLVTWLGQEDAGLSITLRTTMVLFFVGVIAMQVPLGALIASLAFARVAAPTDDARAIAPAPRAVAALGVGIAAFMPLTALLVLGALPQIVVLVAGGLAGSTLGHALTDRLGDARASLVRFVVYALFAVIAALVGVVLDLARAAVGRECGVAAAAGASAPGLSVMMRGVRTALRVARRHLARATFAWASRFGIGIVLVVAGYGAAQRLGGRGGGALLALFLVHQAVTLGRTALRASWLARALALVAPVQVAHAPQGELDASEAAPSDASSA